MKLEINHAIVLATRLTIFIIVSILAIPTTKVENTNGVNNHLN